MKKRLLTALLALFFLPLVFAQANIIIQKADSEALISPLGQASFNIVVTNNMAQPDVFLLELSDVRWSLSTRRAADLSTGIWLNAFESRPSTIYIKPSADIGEGTYYVQLKIRSQETKQATSELFAIRVDPRIIDYNVTLQSEILEPTSIDPSHPSSVKVLIKNPYPVFLTNLTVEASSKFLNKKSTVEIPPKSEKIVDFSLNIDASTPKQQDDVTVTVKQNNKVISKTQKTLYIKEYRLPYKIDTATTEKFLYTIKEITFTNTEGSQKTQDAAIPRPQTYALIFTSPTAKTETFDNQRYLVWTDVSLLPQDTYKVTVVEDYRQIAGVVIALVILIIAYFQFRSPIVVQKKAYSLRKKDTGNNEIKVLLHVRNRSSRYIEMVRVLERLPVIHQVEEEFGPETPEPKFRRDGRQTVLDWDIALAPKEERVFSYKIKSTLPIIGDYILRPCVVQYGRRNRRVSSDPYRLVID